MSDENDAHVAITPDDGTAPCPVPWPLAARHSSLLRLLYDGDGDDAAPPEAVPAPVPSRDLRALVALWTAVGHSDIADDDAGLDACVAAAIGPLQPEDVEASGRLLGLLAAADYFGCTALVQAIARVAVRCVTAADPAAAFGITPAPRCEEAGLLRDQYRMAAPWASAEAMTAARRLGEDLCNEVEAGGLR